MAAKAKAKKKKAKKPAASKAATGSIRIRMYRVGFGDFFLITVPSQDGPKHIIVDCGVTRGKTQKGDIASIKTAVRHMVAETKGKIALIIATHRHQDHIIGFSRCAPEFLKCEVEAIWLSHWETEYEDDVKKAQNGLQSLAEDLRTIALAGDQDETSAEILGIVENATGKSHKEGPGGGTNAASLEILKNKLGVKPQYYFKGKEAKLPESLVEAGLTADILGPPAPNAVDFLKLEDLKKGVGQFLRAAGLEAPDGNRPLMPVSSEFVVKADAYPPNAFREWAPRKPGVFPDDSKRYEKELERSIKASTPAALSLAAKALDNVLNNQSLVVLFGWNGKKFLFAGDAQAGNWEYWLYDLDKPVSDPTGHKLVASSSAILSSIAFYKVGHHGSTNASPISAVNAMGKDFVSMCSVQADSFGSVANESEVPRIPLLTALGNKCCLLRSDQFAIDHDGLKIPAAVKLDLPKPKQGKFVVGSLFVDYFL